MTQLTLNYLRSLGPMPAELPDGEPVAIVRCGACLDLDADGCAVVQITTRRAADPDPATAPEAVLLLQVEPGSLLIRKCVAFRGDQSFALHPAGLPGLVVDLAQSIVMDGRFA